MRKLLNFLKKTYMVLGLIVFNIIILPLYLASIFSDQLSSRIFFFFLFFSIAIILFEFIFLFFYRIIKGFHYSFLKKIDFKKLMFEPHPNLPFVLKKNFKRIKTEKLNYPLSNIYHQAELSTNNWKFYNGLRGDRDIQVPKPNNLIRINCLGASTTGNYINYNNKIFSYPLELERILKEKYKDKNLEVNNCGNGGYTSADILVRFALQVIDSKPDYIIIYHGYNDVRSYLTPNFESDYSHSRKNLGEVYWKYYLGSKIPNIPLNFFNYFVNKFLFPLDERETILEVIKKKDIDMKIDYSKGLEAYKRNLEHIINLCLKNNIKVVLSTFCFFLYPEISNDPLSKIYQKIIAKENDIIVYLANKHNLILVDADSYIEKREDNFVDSAHFTPKGMSLLAECIAEKIILL